MYNKQRSLSIKNIMMELLNEKYRDLALIAKENKKKYQSGTPFPNIHFDDFFNEYFLNEVLEEFPDLKRNSDLKFKNENEVKLASKGEYRFSFFSLCNECNACVYILQQYVVCINAFLLYYWGLSLMQCCTTKHKIVFQIVSRILEAKQIYNLVIFFRELLNAISFV
eukprot:TRINITY_DN37327_c0_g1_i2.p1 TRINITY_DN37327_c0_g1~~TRINITY_DN37327_c0_g1_i2.p1  ORF type:complete len:167 (-),score=1.02 TRINITY_DN37327_c0_g1_i2:24-524(-)